MSADKQILESAILATRCQRGDREAFAGIVRLWERPLFYYLRRLAPSETDAWDVTGQGPLMVSNVVLHSLPSGYRFDLQRRTRVMSPVLRSIEGQEALASS